MELSYWFKVSASVYDRHDHEYYEEEEYCYEVDDDELKEHLLKAFMDEYGLEESIAKQLIDDFDLYERLEEVYSEDDDFCEHLKEIYYGNAYDEFYGKGD